MANGHNLFVAFDLTDPTDNYDRLGQAIVALGIPVKISSTLWYVDSPIGAREAELVLKDACNAGDTLLVIDASRNFAVSHNLRPMSNAMLRTLWNGQPPSRDRSNVAEDCAVTAAVHTADETELPQLAWMRRLFSVRGERRP